MLTSILHVDNERVARVVSFLFIPNRVPRLLMTIFEESGKSGEEQQANAKG